MIDLPVPEMNRDEYRRHLTIGAIAQAAAATFMMSSVVFGEQALEAANTTEAVVRGAIGAVLFAAGLALGAGGAYNFMKAGQYSTRM
jgi:hypothetical protein